MSSIAIHLVPGSVAPRYDDAGMQELVVQHCTLTEQGTQAHLPIVDLVMTGARQEEVPAGADRQDRQQHQRCGARGKPEKSRGGGAVTPEAMEQLITVMGNQLAAQTPVLAAAKTIMEISSRTEVSLETGRAAVLTLCEATKAYNAWLETHPHLTYNGVAST